MLPRAPLSRFVIGLTGLALGLASLSPAGGQGLEDGANALEAQRGTNYKLFRKLVHGEKTDSGEKPKPMPTDRNDKSHLKAIDWQARYVTYTPFLKHLEDQPGAIDKEFKAFQNDIDDIVKNKQETQVLAELYGDRVREHALEVLQYKGTKPIHRLYAARILANLARLGQGKLAETLRDVLKDSNQDDGVHYYALRGLRELFALPPQMPPSVTKEQAAGCAGAIVEFLERPSPVTKASTPEEIDGFRVLRREALRALAQIHIPEVSPKVRPALVLARFAGNDGRLSPPPRIDERIEAAIGLGLLSSGQSKDYQPDYAAGQIGLCIAAFLKAVNEEGKDLSKRLHPWKIYAVKLHDGLSALKSDSGSKNPYVAKLADRGIRAMQVVEKGGTIDAGDVAWFTNPDNAPPSKELFKGAPDSVVNPGAEAKPDTPAKPDKPEKPEKSDKPDKGKKSDKPETPKKPDK